MFVEIVEKEEDCKCSISSSEIASSLACRRIPTTVAELLRFQISMSGDEPISLWEYVGRMKDGQNDIYDIMSGNVAMISIVLSWRYEIWNNICA